MVEADDIILSNIRSNDDGGIDFDMYVEADTNVVLNQEALLQAVMVSSLIQ